MKRGWFNCTPVSLLAVGSDFGLKLGLARVQRIQDGGAHQRSHGARARLCQRFHVKQARTAHLPFWFTDGFNEQRSGVELRADKSCSICTPRVGETSSNRNLTRKPYILFYSIQNLRRWDEMIMISLPLYKFRDYQKKGGIKKKK